MRDPADNRGAVEQRAIGTAIDEFGLHLECEDYVQWLEGGSIPETKESPDEEEHLNSLGVLDELRRREGFDATQSLLHIAPQHPGHPEVVAINHLGSLENEDARFVVTFDEPVYTTAPGEVRLEVVHGDGSHDMLPLSSKASRSNPSWMMEFGPIEDDLIRATRINLTGVIQNSDGEYLLQGADSIQGHPNSLFIDPGLSSRANDPALTRCTVVLGFNDVSPVIVRSVREADLGDMNDEKRSEWLGALRKEMREARIQSDRIELDRYTMAYHPCAPLWAAEPGGDNAHKRNPDWQCKSNDPDVKELLQAPYTDLSAGDRLILRKVLNESVGPECRMHYPQLFFGRWVPVGSQ